MKKVAFSTRATFMKVEESLGLIIGFAMVCEIDGEPYFDLGGDHIPPDAMLKASMDFMKNSRVAGEMHEKNEDGSPRRAGDVIFAFPLTAEIAASLDITTKRTGLLIAMKPDSEETLDKARSGEYGGFSIGGFRIRDQEV